MAYLIIPVICFVLFAGFVWVAFVPRARETTWTGKIDDLGLILSVLMTAGLDKPYLHIKVPRRVTWVKMTFPGSLVRLEMPLVTKLQQSRRESYLAIFRDLELEPQISSDNSGHELLKCDVEGPPARVATVIKDAFIRLFEVDPARELEFQAFANYWDQNVIDHGLRGNPSGGEGELPVAFTQGRDVDPFHEVRSGCMMTLVVLLLLPVPFVIAHLEFGYIAASAILVVFIVAREIYRRWKRPKGGFHLTDFIKITILSLTGATIYSNDPLYLQLVPTIVLSVVAVAELLSASFDLPKISAFGPAKNDVMPRLERLLFSFSVVTACIGTAAMNEYLRNSVTLDAWVWFFAFFRIEFVLGFLTTAMPFIFYISLRDPKTDGDSDSA